MKRLKLICLDTSVLIWGIQGYARESQKGLVKRTANYLKSLERDSVRIVVPTPVLAEYLCGIPGEVADRQRQVIAKRFRIAEFGEDAAAVCSDLTRDLWRRSRDFKELAQQSPNEKWDRARQRYKVDCQVIAVAIDARADVIITGEPQVFRMLAGDRISVSDVPVVEIQKALPFRGGEPG